MQANEIAQTEVSRLIETRFVFHAWQDLLILGPDGAMFHLDTKKLDVDHPVNSSGTAWLKRLRLLPVTATQRPNINNKEGFAVSNLAVGTIDANGQAGIGSGLAGATKTNVEAKWHYPTEKIVDMVYTFGRYGLTTINSLTAFTADDIARCNKIFRVVMSGLGEKTLLEDMPEYFGEISPYLLDKRPARFAQTAEEVIFEAATKGISIGGQTVRLNESEEAAANSVANDIRASIMVAHYAALDLDGNGVLAKTREGIQTKKKLSYDKADIWLMNQFPSFPMDSELEKSQKQLIKVLGDDGPSDAAAFVPIEQFNELAQRLAAMEAALGGPAAVPPSAAPAAPVA